MGKGGAKAKEDETIQGFMNNIKMGFLTKPALIGWTNQLEEREGHPKLRDTKKRYSGVYG